MWYYSIPSLFLMCYYVLTVLTLCIYFVDQMMTTAPRIPALMEPPVLMVLKTSDVIVLQDIQGKTVNEVSTEIMT